jgi:adenylate cyclase
MRNSLEFETYALDLDRLTLTGPAGAVALRPKSFEVLRHLLSCSGRLVTKDDLLKTVWPDVTVSDESLAQCISEIRRALGDDGARIVKTVPRRGYLIDIPVRAAASAAVGTVEQETSATTGSVEPKRRSERRTSIAALPIEAAGADSGSQFIAFLDGLSEDIIDGLSRIRALLVISGSTMSGYKGKPVDVRAVGRELDVRYVLRSRVRHGGARLRATVQLTETATGHQVWAAKFDRDIVDWFDLQDDLAQCIVASVQVQLIVSEGRTPSRRDQGADVPADLLARSREQLYLGTAESLREVVATAERVLRSDSANGLACRLLSAGLWHLVYKGYAPWTGETGSRIVEFAERAVLSEDADEYAHWALALAQLYHGHHERAAAALRHALDLNPNFSLAYGTLGTVHAWAGDPERSIENNQLALRLNPGDPLNTHRYFGLALAHYLAGRYAAALENAIVAVGIRTDWWLTQMVLTASLVKLGRLAEARAALADLLRAKPDIKLSALDVLPFAKPADRDHVAVALRQSGLT